MDKSNLSESVRIIYKLRLLLDFVREMCSKQVKDGMEFCNDLLISTQNFRKSFGV